MRSLGHHLTLGALAPLAPIMLWQGRRVRRTTPRLPDAAGDTDGATGTGPRTLRIAVLGESTVSGVGARTLASGLPGRLAHELAAATQSRVEWRAIGRNGATARRIAQIAVPALAEGRPDIAFIVLGVNDVLEFTPIDRWQSDVRALCDLLEGVKLIVLAGVPPMHRFPSLPQPLRTLLGSRARALDKALAALARAHDALVHVPTPAQGDASFFCEDRFHPSEAGYKAWAAQTVAAVRPALTTQGLVN